MIYLNGINLETIGLKCSDVKGYRGFPSLKKDGVSWPDSNYSEVTSRNIDFQFNSRMIELDCYAVGTNWADLDSKISAIKSALIFNGLKMLTIPHATNRGYMVRLSKSTIFQPIFHFRNGKSIAVFKVQFEEPQPFNIQFYFKENSDVVDPSFGLSLVNAMKSLSIKSDEQKFVKVCWNGSITDTNIEQEDYSWSGAFTFKAKIPYPVIIIGEVDALQLVGIVSDLTPLGVDLANLFMRNSNGELIIA